MGVTNKTAPPKELFRESAKTRGAPAVLRMRHARGVPCRLSRGGRLSNRDVGRTMGLNLLHPFSA